APLHSISCILFRVCVGFLFGIRSMRMGTISMSIRVCRRISMKQRPFRSYIPVAILASSFLLTGQGAGIAADKPTSYAPVAVTEDFAAIKKRMESQKKDIAKRHQSLLESRYDLSDRPAAGVTMSGGKPIQEGVRVKLPKGLGSWQDLAAMTPDEIREKDLFPAGFMPLP